MNGVDLKDLSVGSVRRQVGVVGQEPVLFGCTVEDNIRYGCEGASLDDIEQAAREANAHDFISQLPQVTSTNSFGILRKTSFRESHRGQIVVML